MFFSKIRIISLCLIVLCFVCACKSPLLPVPVPSSGESLSEATVAANWKAPANLSASHGKKQQITLSWDSVNKASRYYIFKADNQFSEFVQAGETTANETTFNLKVKAGTSAWYKVCAVDVSGDKSPLSSAAFGTSLATPLISNIEGVEGSEDTSVNIFWYMNNVSSSTYLDNVCYEISYYADGNEKNVYSFSLPESLNAETRVQIDGLVPNTSYSFCVDACLVNAQTDTESSGFMTAETARRQVPNKVENLVASEGTVTDGVVLSFVLPEKVDVSVGNKIFEEHSIYFKIYRKLETASDNDYQEICSYFGSDSSIASDPENCFADQYTKDVPDEIYCPGKTVEWKDKNAVRGKKYNYKVQSYVDGIERVISSNNSVSVTCGWEMTIPSFKTTNYTPNKVGDNYESSELSFNSSWDNFGAEENYYFVVTEKRYLLECDNGDVSDTEGAESNKFCFESMSSLNTFKRQFTSLNIEAKDRGYYTYSFYAIPKDKCTTYQEASIEDKAISVNAIGRTLVSNSVSNPEIKNFVVDDGYVDKFIISWEYDDKCEYTLSYKSLDIDGQEIGNSTVDISSGTINENIFTVVDLASSGDIRKYSLRALNGVSVESNLDESKTLGKPSLETGKPYYDSITIKWKPVQKANKYTVSFMYDDSSSLPVSSIDGKSLSDKLMEAELIPETTEGFVTDEEGYYNWKIDKALGYDNAQISGRPLTVSLVASNDKGSTSSDVSSRTLGPALLKANATKSIAESEIKVTWNAVSNVDGYIVRRERYDINNSSVVSTDLYFVNSDGTKVSASNEEDKTRVTVEKNTDIISIHDKYAALPESATSWQDNQDKIAWGYPYHYVVFPVSSSSDEFDVDSKTLAGCVCYNDLAKVSDVGSAIGYGHNVNATKAESNKSVIITWDKPYSIGATQPVLYRRQSGNSGAFEKTDISVDVSGDKFVFIPSGTERTIPFDFAVVYGKEAPHTSYTNYLAETAKDDDYNEAINKGYIFSVALKMENVPEDGKTSYTEKATWTLYDTSVRARGPESDYIVAIKNPDFASDWQTVASINKDTKDVTINSSSSYKTDITKVGTDAITLCPKDMTSQAVINDGLLQVLRGYKHYGKLEVSRTNSNGETIYASYSDSDVYARRKITDAELTKAVMLAYTYPFFKAANGNDNYDNITSCYTKDGKTVNDELGGSFVLSNGAYQLSGKYKHNYNFNNYAPSMLSFGGSSERFIKINASTTEFLRKGGSEGFFVLCETAVINFKCFDIETSDYSGTINISFANSKKFSISLSRNGIDCGTIANESTQDGIRKWFPMRIYGDLGIDDSYWFTSSTYGWWK